MTRARGALLAAGAVAIACGSAPDAGELPRGVPARASAASFRDAGVSLVVERRCGTLDCHGTAARNLRVYSSQGLRLPNGAGRVPGQGDTTPDEITASYQSLLTLEPEATQRLLDGGDPYDLLIVRKPLEIESHKGGPAMRRGDDVERCIVSWLREELAAPVDAGACKRAAAFPKE